MSTVPRKLPVTLWRLMEARRLPVEANRTGMVCLSWEESLSKSLPWTMSTASLIANKDPLRGLPERERPLRIGVSRSVIRASGRLVPMTHTHVTWVSIQTRSKTLKETSMPPELIYPVLSITPLRLSRFNQNKSVKKTKRSKGLPKANDHELKQQF